MASREKQRRIDDQWQALQPGWGRKDYQGERKMLYGLLEPGEDVELLHSCGFDTKNVVWGSRHDRGVVVATGRRVILLKRGRLSKNRFGLTYLEIDEITEPEPGRVRLRGSGSGNATGSESGAVFDLDLQFAAAEFSRFVRGHLLSDEESVAAAFSHVLALGEQVRHWAHCSAGPETVYHKPSRHYSGGGGEPEYWSTSWSGRPALAVDTGRRILLITLAVHTDLLLHARAEEVIASCPHGTILAVEYTEHTEGQEVRFVDQGGQVYAAHFRREADALPFVNIMQEHAAAPRQVSGQPRILADWRLLHPIWGHRDNHGNERNKLAEILDNDEHLEGLLWGTYSPELQWEKGHSGIIAATNRRLLFVSNSRDDKHVSQLPLHGIASVSRGGGKLRIDATLGYASHMIDGLDDMSRHHSRKKGQVEVFTARLQRLVADPPH